MMSSFSVVLYLYDYDSVASITSDLFLFYSIRSEQSKLIMTFELQDKEHEMKQWTNIRVFDCWDRVYQTHLFSALSQHIQQCSWCAMMTWWLHLWIETLLLQLNYPRSWLLLLICCHPHQLQEKLQKYRKHSCLFSIWIIKDRCLQIYKKLWWFKILVTTTTCCHLTS